MTTRDLRGLRAGYLFALGHLCHVPPAAADELTLADFANLTDSIDAHIEAQNRR